MKIISLSLSLNRESHMTRKDDHVQCDNNTFINDI